MRARRWIARIAALVAVALVGCGGAEHPSATMVTATPPAVDPAAPRSLYDRLGGKPAIEQVVDLFLSNVGADPRINTAFVNADAARLRAMLIAQICDAASAGTACHYTGKSMPEVHKGMAITDAQFDAIVEDLVAALATAGVGAAEQADLLAVLGPMRPEIVGK